MHANIQKDGTFSVVPQMRGGVTTPDQLRRIADVADKYSVPMVKLTGGQRIDLLGIKKEDLPGVWADLGMPSGYAYGKSFRTVKTCVGQEFCRFGTGDSTKLGIEIETRMQGMESPAKMKLAVSGCPRNCAESLVKDVGIVAIEGGRWEIYIGGAAGAHIRKGDLLCTVDDAETAKLLTGRFLQYYRENAKWLERTYSFVPRVGLDLIKAVVVEDSEGIAERLDAAVQEHADTYVDPWTQGADPVTPGQFRTSLPLEVLPRVPSGRAEQLLGGAVVSRGGDPGLPNRAVDRAPARPRRPDPARRGPGVRGRRGSDRGVPAPRRQPARPVGGLHPQGWADRRRPDRRPHRLVPPAHERLRTRHRVLAHRGRTAPPLRRHRHRRRDRPHPLIHCAP